MSAHAPLPLGLTSSLSPIAGAQGSSPWDGSPLVTTPSDAFSPSTALRSSQVTDLEVDQALRNFFGSQSLSNEVNKDDLKTMDTEEAVQHKLAEALLDEAEDSGDLNLALNSVLARLDELVLDAPDQTVNAVVKSLQGGVEQQSEQQNALLPQRLGARDCAYYMRTGTCAFGGRCRFHHPRERELRARATRNLAGGASGGPGTSLPQRPGEPPCHYFVRTGSCRFGAGCKFDHPPLPMGANSSATPAVPVVGAPAASSDSGNGSDASGSSPPSGPPSMNGRNSLDGSSSPTPAAALNSIGLPLRPGVSGCAFYLRHGTCKYGATCRYHHPERSVSESCLPCAPGGSGQWASTDEAGGALAGSVDAAKGTAETSSSALSFAANGASAKDGDVNGLAHRPGASPCPFYLRTGQCKFGTTCRFDHPEDRVTIAAQHGVLVTRLGPLGLPLRPGAAPCPFYLKTGRCKFSVTCKFDHPVWDGVGAMAAAVSAGAAPISPGLPTPVGSSGSETSLSSASSSWNAPADAQEAARRQAEDNLDRFLSEMFAN